MIKPKKLISTSLIITITLATFLITTVQAETVQAKSKVSTKITLSQDQIVAASVDKLIASLPKTNKITLNNEAAVNNANTAYNALTDVQKTLVKSANSTKLAASIKKIEDLKQVAIVNQLIEALPKTNKITLANETAVNDAYTAFTALSKSQKVLLNKSNSGKIIAATKQIAKLKKFITNSLRQINSGDEEFTAFAKAGVTGAVESNKAAYDSAIAKAKEQKGSDLTLVEIQTAIDSVNQAIADSNAAQLVVDQISALDSNKDTYATDVASARSAYDGLTDAQKSLVTNYENLVTAEQAIANSSADQLVINQIP